MPQFTAAVYGATGYLGAELLRRLYIHPNVEVVRTCAADHLGEAIASAQPHLEGVSSLVIEAIPEREVDVAPVDVLFLALPHTASWNVVRQLRGTGTRIIDCSGAFRSSSPDIYQRYYGATHPLPELLEQFVYGLPEVNRERVRGAQFVASPGCFATAIELGLLPFARAGLLQGAVQCVGITGSSGSGSTPGAGTHHPTRAGNLRTYKPLTHQHVPEVEELLTRAGARDFELEFVPVSSPLVRGIFVTSFVHLTQPLTTSQLDAVVDATFATEPFVRRPKQRLPEVVAVTNSNYAEVRYAIANDDAAANTAPGQCVTCVSALDNLLKGGAGQAVQNMNLMLGLAEDCGLKDPGGYP
jgi:LysW-gamma-L-alpha-aminoadipyl-6-phosphate/LysW-L-glutamyl-5-phosphate reductase